MSNLIGQCFQLAAVINLFDTNKDVSTIFDQSVLVINGLSFQTTGMEETKLRDELTVLLCGC